MIQETLIDYAYSHHENIFKLIIFVKCFKNINAYIHILKNRSDLQSFFYKWFKMNKKSNSIMSNTQKIDMKKNFFKI